MLIVQSGDVRLAVIGCCRVMRPLLLMSERGRVATLFDLAENFTYGVDDARQYLDVLTGRRRIPAELAAYVFSGQAPTDEQVRQAQALLETCDVVVVEIGMSRSFSYGPYTLNPHQMINILMGRMGEQEGWAWYRNRLHGRSDDTDLSGLAPLQQDMARRISVVSHDVSDFAETLSAMMDEKRWIVATHLLWGDGPLMTERALRVRAVTEAARQVGAEVFDPTPHLREGSLEDMEHYALDFLPEIGERLLQAAHRPKVLAPA